MTDVQGSIECGLGEKVGYMWWGTGIYILHMRNDVTENNKNSISV